MHEIMKRIVDVGIAPPIKLESAGEAGGALSALFAVWRGKKPREHPSRGQFP
jgi:hypothetical protein